MSTSRGATLLQGIVLYYVVFGLLLSLWAGMIGRAEPAFQAALSVPVLDVHTLNMSFASYLTPPASGNATGTDFWSSLANGITGGLTTVGNVFIGGWNVLAMLGQGAVQLVLWAASVLAYAGGWLVLAVAIIGLTSSDPWLGLLFWGPLTLVLGMEILEWVRGRHG